MIRGVALVLGLMAASGCQTQTEMTVPAVLDDASESTIADLKSQLATALNRTGVRLAEADFASSARVTVIPPPLGPHEMNSRAIPIDFDLFLRGERCYVVRVETGDEIALKGITCRALS